MTSSRYFDNEAWEEEEWPVRFSDAAVVDNSLPVEMALILAVVLIALALGWAALHLIKQTDEATILPLPRAGETASDNTANQPPSPILSDPSSIIAPYNQYIITQGIHGQSYGHLAVDIAAGKGASISSPITGLVSQKYFDAVGNPTLVIENEHYIVTFLHGIYTVDLGDKLQIGDEIGKESNIGNTRDMQGFSCRGRDCGYHTHLNIFDKITGSNINPLDVIGSSRR